LSVGCTARPGQSGREICQLIGKVGGRVWRDARERPPAARRCGYASEFAFAKAFKREFAVTPGAFRRAPDLLARDPATDPAVVQESAR
jgi:hypothetical protein